MKFSNQVIAKLVAVAFGVVACCSLASPTQAAVIAYWRFEPGNFTGDSAGGNTLANTGVTSSVDVATNAPGTGSANFDGNQTLFNTIGNLNLSPYSQITIEWFMKSTQSSIGQVFEHNAGSGEGAFGGYINDAVADRVEMYSRGTGGATYVEDALRPLDGEWHHFAITIDSTLAGADRNKLFIDGIDVGDENPSYPGAGAPAFLDAIWSFGQRGGTNYRLVGLLDEVRISSGLLDPSQFLNAPAPAPEPTSAVLLGLGLICLTNTRKRRRASTNVNA